MPFGAEFMLQLRLPLILALMFFFSINFMLATTVFGQEGDDGAGDYDYEEEVEVLPMVQSIWSIEWSPDGTAIAMGVGPDQCNNFANNYAVVVLDAATGQQIRYVGEANQCAILSLDWSPNGSNLVGSGYSTATYVWDVNTGYSIQIIAPRIGTGYLDNIWNPDGVRIASVDSNAIIWDSVTGNLLYDLPANSPTSLTWNPDGTRLATSSRDISIWDVNTGTLVQTINSSNAGELTWSPDGTRIAGSQDNNIVIWDVLTGNVLHSFSGHSDYITEVVWRFDSESVASSSFDGTVRIWGLANNELIESIPYAGQVYALDWSPDGEYIAFGGARSDGQNAEVVTVIAPSLIACTTTVPDTPALLSAIASANATPEPDTICLEAGTYTLDAPITSEITLVGLGAGAEISGSLQVSGAGRLTLRNVTVNP
jgi:WD40 repeat protein